MRFLHVVPVAGLIALAGCVPPPAAAPTPAPARPITPRPAPAPSAPPPSSADWRDAALAPGTWRYARDGRGSAASFGEGGGTAQLTLRCDRWANAVHLVRAGGGRGTGFVVRTSTATRALPTQPAGGGEPAIAAVLTPDDRLLDAIGFSRGRFVVEDCRS